MIEIPLYALIIIYIFAILGASFVGILITQGIMRMIEKRKSKK